MLTGKDDFQLRNPQHIREKIMISPATEVDFVEGNDWMYFGVEYSVNIISLDLSHNQISNILLLSSLSYLTALDLSYNLIDDISALAELESLISLDLSFNNISDIEPLLKLPCLEYVNLIGNKILTPKTIEALKKRGAVVIN